MTWQLVIDCRQPERLVRFWAEALGYRPQPPPDGHPTWRDWYLSVGVPAEELGEGDCLDRLEDSTGAGPSIWFQPVPEGKPDEPRTGLHLDLMPTLGTRAEEGDRLVGLGPTVVSDERKR